MRHARRKLSGASQFRYPASKHAPSGSLTPPLARGSREPRAEVRPTGEVAKEAQIFPFLFAPSPRTLQGRSGNGSRSKPAEWASRAARRLISMCAKPLKRNTLCHSKRWRIAPSRQDLPIEFKFDESPVRVVLKDGEPWFVAKDVCDILDIATRARPSAGSMTTRQVRLLFVRPWRSARIAHGE